MARRGAEGRRRLSGARGACGRGRVRRQWRGGGGGARGGGEREEKSGGGVAPSASASPRARGLLGLGLGLPAAYLWLRAAGGQEGLGFRGGEGAGSG